MSKGKFYHTTPAYYVNDVPHIGHAYTEIASDVIARFKRMEGYDVFFVTGSDEHGNKIAQSAEQHGKKPKEWADTVVKKFEEAWKKLDISYDLLIRTTDDYHESGVRKLFETIKDNGLIYLGDYEGWYCVPDEAFWTETQIVNGNCPDCGRPVERVKEKSYFFDALINYLTACGYGNDEKRFREIWPPDLHLMGKEIMWFHTVIWPAMLMAAGLPLPKRVFGHGWWTVEGQKMSKSLGNVVDPIELSNTYSADAVRYFLLREGVFGKDGDFSLSSMISRINNELANDLGNLFSRTLAMIKKYNKGAVPRPADNRPADEELLNMAKSLSARFKNQMEHLQFSFALEEIWSFVRRCNKYVEENAPWELAKSAEKKPRLETVLYNLAESLRIITILLAPFMPKATLKMWSQLGLDNFAAVTFDEADKWGLLREGTVTKPGEALFPKVKT
ncbi:MAG: class I tRNA ligase family protein [Candidatus Lindowbacteria bacterium]|nr:class I tRNA ligase family protein [Candidatus Lindowbacteria bacterium]